MAQSPESIRASLDLYLSSDYRGRLRARGIARGMVWRDGVVPEGSPSFPSDLTADLLDFGYGVLALALELRDANRRRPAEARIKTSDAFEVAAEALESAVRRGDHAHPENGRHLVVSAAAFHLGGFAARSYSLLPPSALARNLASAERALALLLRRDLVPLRELMVDWQGSDDYSDDTLTARLQDDDDDFASDDATLLALTRAYFRALGLGDSALNNGIELLYERAIAAMDEVIKGAALVGNLPTWWVATLSIHLLRDLWDQSLHVHLPRAPNAALPQRWDGLRHDFIVQLAARRPPHVDLWPSQLEAARRSIDPADDLVIALPTSAGKTRIAELCILRTLADDKRVVYVTPLRALSAQVERVLARTFAPLGASVTALYGAVGVSTVDGRTLADADVVVSTPEKLDFALRQDPHVLDSVALIVLDEGHMIGLGSREVRYEVLIQRLLRREDAADRRIVCLSAMFNTNDVHFDDFNAWVRSDEPGAPIHVGWRPTRQRLAHLDWAENAGAARLSFLEGEAAFVTRFVEGQPPRGRRTKPYPANEIEFCIAAANAFAGDGHTVLLYSPQRSQIEPLVREFKRMHLQGYLTQVRRPDPADLVTVLAIGREWLGAQHAAVQAIELGVGTHHGALPRPFQSVIEELLEKKRLPVVVASPTLAQGLDLSCSVLLFRSLTRFDPETSRPKPIGASEFANVIGRAGRAYVDLEGIVALPSFESGWPRTNRHQQFAKLLADSRAQHLSSGLAQLVWQLVERISAKLDVQLENLLEYVLNHGGLWSDDRVLAIDQVDEDEDHAIRTFDEYLSDLDVAILSLLDDLDVPIERLAEALDEILKDSLWKRTLDREEDGRVAEIERKVIFSRARWLWSNTSFAERRACFSSGLGERAGTFLYRNLDALVDLLSRLQGAVATGDARNVADLSVRFAERVTTEASFSVRKPPNNWTAVLSQWVSGIALADILSGLKVREEQRTQAFVQDGVVFKLVWAAEAVRVQATSDAHARASELGDGPMLALTHGVPSIPAALLCQAGYASRVGALWVTSALSSTFSDLDGMRDWMRANAALLADDDFWSSPDHRMLWHHMLRPTGGDFPRRWNRRIVVVAVRWHDGVGPTAGTSVRILARADRTAHICADDLSPLGMARLPFNPEGAALDGTVAADGQLSVVYFGPN